MLTLASTTQVASEPVPWGVRALLHVLNSAWLSVFQDALTAMDRRPVQKAIKRLTDTERRAGRAFGPAADEALKDALSDIHLLLHAFPEPAGGPAWVQSGSAGLAG